MIEPSEHDTLPPALDPAVDPHIVEPPRNFLGIARQLGPGLIIAGSIVGSGELIATTKTGAQAGISLLWLILVGCVIKVFVQIELGRHTIGHGETTLAALDRVPGPRMRVNWIVWCWLAMMLIGTGQLGAIVGGVGQSLALTVPITGDYMDANRMPSTGELKRYVRNEPALLSLWDLQLAWQDNEASGNQGGASAPHDAEGGGADAARWTQSVVDQTRADLEDVRAASGEAAREAVAAAEELFRAEDQGRPSLVLELRVQDLLVQLNADALAAPRFREKIPAREDLAEAAAAERRRTIRGHVVLSNQLRKLDREGGRSARALAAVRRLDALEQELEQAEQEGSSAAIAEARGRVAELRAVVGALIEPRTYDDKYWSAVIAVFTSILLFFGRYRLIQNISMVLVVSFTFVTVGNVISLQGTQRWHISASEILRGLSFTPPEARPGINPITTALATFGIIGVGASELIAYPYWCIEKGYAKYTGPHSADAGWARRARGWMRVMHYDAFFSMIVYTIATLAFFLMGVGVLHNEGRDPDGMRMVSTLAAAYVPVFGEYARWLFLIGAFAVLYSTFLVANAQNARMYTDALKLFGIMSRNDQMIHDRSVKTLSVLLPLLCLAVFCTGVNPVTAILVSGTMQALLLPMIGIGALYFRYRRTEPRLRPSMVWDALLVISCAGLLVAGAWSVYSQLFGG